MSSAKKILGVMLAENQARIAVVEPQVSGGKVISVTQVALATGASWAERLVGVEAEMKALGGGKRTMVWVACSLPEMQFAILSAEKMEHRNLGPVAWMKFKKEVENLPEKVIFDYEVQDTLKGGLVPMWDMTAFATPYEEVEQLEYWFGSRYNLQGITMDLFADRNLIAMSRDHDATVALLSCDAHMSRIMVIKGGRTMFTRTIKAGTGLLIDFAEKVLKRTVAPHELHAVLRSDVIKNPALLNGEQQILQQACTDGINRLFTQVGRTLDYYTDHMKRQRPEALLLTGCTDYFQHAMPALSERFGLEVKMLDPENCNISYSVDVADLFSKGGAEHYSSAIGVAMGRSGRTPNLVCTHDVMTRMLRIKQVRSWVAGIFVVLAALLFGALIWQMNLIHTQKTDLNQCESIYAGMEPYLEMDTAAGRLRDLQLAHVGAERLARRNILAAVLGEAQALTPPEFRIKTLELDINEADSFILEGVVLDQLSAGESYLAKYVVDLNASPFLTHVVLTSDFESEEVIELKRKGVLPFTIKGKVVQMEAPEEK